MHSGVHETCPGTHGTDGGVLGMNSGHMDGQSKSSTLMTRR